jgi:hypothetical protein
MWYLKWLLIYDASSDIYFIHERKKIKSRTSNSPVSWGLSGYQACWRVADSQGPVLVAGPWTNSPTPSCYVWLALIRAEGVNGTWVMCFFNGASGKPGDIQDYVALQWYRELYQC